MKNLARVSILLALLFTVMTAIPILWLYTSLAWERDGNFANNSPRGSVVKMVAKESDVNKLRLTCVQLAKAEDDFIAMNEISRRTLNKVLWGGIPILLLWSGLAIAGHLYVAWHLRKLIKAQPAP